MNSAAPVGGDKADKPKARAYVAFFRLADRSVLSWNVEYIITIQGYLDLLSNSQIISSPRSAPCLISQRVCMPVDILSSGHEPGMRKTIDMAVNPRCPPYSNRNRKECGRWLGPQPPGTLSGLQSPRTRSNIRDVFTHPQVHRSSHSRRLCQLQPPRQPQPHLPQSPRQQQPSFDPPH